MSSNNNSPLSDFMMKYWQVVVAVISLVAAFTTTQIAIKEHERRITASEIKIEELQKSNNNLDKKISSIEDNITWIREALQEIKRHNGI